MTFGPLPPRYITVRDDVQRVAAHVLVRARHAVVGRLDLVPTPGGIGTPAFGDDHRVIRLSPRAMFVERTAAVASTEVVALAGASLADLARAAGVDLSTELSVGHDTPALGDPDRRLDLDPAVISVIGDWFAFVERVLDDVIAGRSEWDSPGRSRLWPEHLDLAVDVGVVGPVSRLNLGGSAGDGSHGEPYLYIGPWGPERPGDAAFWNAPFGAVLAHADLLAADDPLRSAIEWMEAGISRFG